MSNNQTLHPSTNMSSQSYPAGFPPLTTTAMLGTQVQPQSGIQRPQGTSAQDLSQGHQYTSGVVAGRSDIQASHAQLQVGPTVQQYLTAGHAVRTGHPMATVPAQVGFQMGGMAPPSQAIPHQQSGAFSQLGQHLPSPFIQSSNQSYHHLPAYANPIPSGMQALPPALQLGHPANLPSHPVQSSFHQLMALSSSGFPSHTGVTPAEMQSARARVNQTRRDAISRHGAGDSAAPRAKGRKPRGPAHNVPVMDRMPTMSVTKARGLASPTCNVSLRMLPAVAIPLKKLPVPVLHRTRDEEFKQHLEKFGAVHTLMNIDVGRSLLDILTHARHIMESGPFRYRFSDLDEIIAQAGPQNAFGQLPFEIMVPGNTTNRRSSSGAFHLMPSEQFEELTLRGLMNHPRVVNAPEAFSYADGFFIIRVCSRVPFTARAHTAFPSEHRRFRDQHSCIGARMGHLFATDNPSEIGKAYRRDHLLDYDYTDPDLSSSDEGQDRAERRRNGHPVLSTLDTFDEDLEPSDDELSIPTTGRRVATMRESNSSEEDVVNYLDRPFAHRLPGNSATQAVLPQIHPSSVPVLGTAPPQVVQPSVITAEITDSTIRPVAQSIGVPSRYAREAMPSHGAGHALPLPTAGNDSQLATDSHMAIKEQEPFVLFPDLTLVVTESTLVKVAGIPEFITLIQDSAVNPSYPQQHPKDDATELDAIAPLDIPELDLAEDSLDQLVGALDAKLQEAFEKEDFAAFLSPGHRMVSVGNSTALGDGVLRDAMARLYGRYEAATERYFTTIRGDYYAIPPGVSRLQPELVSQTRLKQFGALGALVGLHIAINGRAPPRFSPLHFLYAASERQLSCFTASFVHKYDPELVKIMKALRKKGPRGKLTQPEWLDYFLTYVGSHPNTFDSFSDDDKQAWKQWYLLEGVLFRALTFGSETPELKAFNKGLGLPCKNGFNLFSAAGALDGGYEVFIDTVWAPSLIDYDLLSPHLRFQLELKGRTAGDILQTLQASGAFLGQDIPETDRRARSALRDLLEGHFRRAMRTHPSRFAKLIRASSRRGDFKEPPSPDDIANDAFIVRCFYRACTGSTTLLGQGLNQVRVIFIDNPESSACKHNVPDFAACHSLVNVPIPTITKLLAAALPPGAKSFTSAEDVVDWWILESCIGSAESFTKL